MKLFVWDFHGVLEKGNDQAVVEITNHVLKQHGYSRTLSIEEGELLSGRRWYEYFAFLIPGIDPHEYLRLQSHCVEISQTQPEIVSKHIRLNDHADHVLQNIEMSQNTQILISNTQPKSLDWFVKDVGIEKYFPPSHRFAVDSHSQPNQSKKDCLEIFLKRGDFPNGIVSIGDSPADMALIHNRHKGVGYLYAHPGRDHRVVECHYKINDLRYVLQEIEKEK